MYTPCLLMEVELGDRKDIDRLAMPQGTLTPSVSGIVYRAFVYNLVVANLPKLGFSTFSTKSTRITKSRPSANKGVTGSVAPLPKL